MDMAFSIVQTCVQFEKKRLLEVKRLILVNSGQRFGMQRVKWVCADFLTQNSTMALKLRLERVGYKTKVGNNKLDKEVKKT